MLFENKFSKSVFFCCARYILINKGYSDIDNFFSNDRDVIVNNLVVPAHTVLIVLSYYKSMRIMLDKDTPIKSLAQALKNPFYSDESREIILNIHQIAYKMTLVLRKIIRYNLIKCATCHNNDTDLQMTQLGSYKNHLKIHIYQERCMYVFALRDLLNIILNALTNSTDFISEPLQIKNPYTNKSFDKGVLYNVYEKLKRSDYTIPVILHAFYVSHFDFKTFIFNFTHLIQNEIIERTFKNLSRVDGIYHIKEMIDYCKFDRHIGTTIHIHPTFPKHVLYDTFRPFLKDYFYSRYCLDDVRRKESRVQFFIAIYIFKEMNKMFGRCISSTRNENKRLPEYIITCKSYYEINHLIRTNNYTMCRTITSRLNDYVSISLNDNNDYIIMNSDTDTDSDTDSDTDMYSNYEVRV